MSEPSRAGVNIVFDPAFDGGSWPGPATADGSAFGEAWVGPSGLLALLETGLGLSAAATSLAERTIDLTAKLRLLDGFWRRSFEADAIATSQRLLHDRDLLMMQGWEGETLGPRLDAIWQATRDALPGLVDRIAGITKMLASRQVDVATLALCQERSSFAPRWQAMFDALESQGVAIAVRPVDSHGGNAPSPTLFRPHGPLAAANEVAASLAQLGSLDGVVVIGGDSMLDDAFARHGLPRIGLPLAPPASHVLLPLVLETAWAPMDPQSLHALLCMDPGVVPRSVAKRLLRALGAMPGRYGPDWQREKAAALDSIADEARRKAIASRMDALLMPVVSLGEAMTVAQLELRLAALSRWAESNEHRGPTLHSVISQCERLLTLVRASQLEEFDLPILLELAEAASPGSTGGRAEAGIASVLHPAAIVGRAKTIIWWDFTRAAAPRAQSLRLSAQECEALAAHGIAAPNVAASMAVEARRWRLPLAYGDTLVLVCPEVDEAGERSYPHPLWDELSTSASPEIKGVTSTSQLLLPAVAMREPQTLAALPQSFDEIQTTSRLPLREFESPSSLKTLLGCSLRWGLRYHGQIYGGISAGPGEPSPRLYGTVAHYILAEVFGEGALPADAAADRAGDLVDKDLGRLCEALGLPRYQDELGIVRRAIVESARRLGELLEESGARVGSVEEEVIGKFGALQLKGRADMILRSPDVVIDLKWGASSNRKLLKSGTALQLAAYAHAAQVGDALPGVAYFVLKDQGLLGEVGCPLPDTEVEGTITAEETWRLAMLSLTAKLEELSTGRLVAPGALADVVESAATEDGLILAPECQYCDLGAICGRSAAR